MVVVSRTNLNEATLERESGDRPTLSFYISKVYGTIRFILSGNYLPPVDCGVNEFHDFRIEICRPNKAGKLRKSATLWYFIARVLINRFAADNFQNDGQSLKISLIWCQHHRLVTAGAVNSFLVWRFTDERWWINIRRRSRREYSRGWFIWRHYPVSDSNRRAVKERIKLLFCHQRALGMLYMTRDSITNVSFFSCGHCLLCCTRFAAGTAEHTFTAGKSIESSARMGA